MHFVDGVKAKSSVVGEYSRWRRLRAVLSSNVTCMQGLGLKDILLLTAG